MGGDTVVDLLQLGQEGLALPTRPAAPQSRRVALKPQAPVGQVGRWDDGGIMGPVFEQAAVAFDQP